MNLLKSKFTFFFILSLTFLIIQSNVSAQPLPNSPVISNITWDDKSTVVRKGENSDNWPVTWAADGHLYTSPQDGWGFENINTSLPKISMGVSRMIGSPGSFIGEDIWEGDCWHCGGEFDGKSSSLLSINGIFYQLYGPGSDWTAVTETRLAWSAGSAAAWDSSDPNLFFTYTDGFAGPAFINFGKDYQGARDNYVYFYSPDVSGGDPQVTGNDHIHMLMGRVLKDKITDRSAYEFYKSKDANGYPIWTSNVNARGHLFTDTNGVGFPTVSYNKGLRRYIMVVIHGLGNLGIFDAPEPWGPWTTVEYTSNWNNSITMYIGNIPTKTPDWTSDDGKRFHMMFNGFDVLNGQIEPIAKDAYQHLRGRFNVFNQAPKPTISANTASGTAPLTVNFSSAGSHDPEGSSLSYKWNFADNTLSNAATPPPHTFNNPGIYTVSLETTDSGNASAAKAFIVTVNAPGTPAITSPAHESTLAGSAVTFQWSPQATNNITEWWLYVGSTVGGQEYHDSKSISANTFSRTVSGLPTDGSPVHARLFYKINNSSWQQVDFLQYTAFGGSSNKTLSVSINGNGSVISSPSGINCGGTCNASFTHGENVDLIASPDSGNTFTGFSNDPDCADGNISMTKNVNCIVTFSLISGNTPSITSPSVSTLSGSSQTFTWTSNGASVQEYYLGVGTSPQNISTDPWGNIHSASSGLNTSVTVNNIPTDGSSIYLRLWFKINNNWLNEDYQYTTHPPTLTPTMSAPSPNSTLNGSSQTFNWVSNGAAVQEYYLGVGTSPQSVSTNPWGDIHAASSGLNTSVTVNNIPTDGSTIYVRLWFKVNNNWLNEDYQYTAHTPIFTPTISAPSPNSTLNGSSQTFRWVSNGAAVQEYYLSVGTTPQSVSTNPWGDIHAASSGLNTSVTVNNIPTDGNFIYLRLWFKIDNNWLSEDYQYTAANF